MKYSKIVEGTFVDRPNRFIAHVNIEGTTETVHVKNTGRCKELLLPGAKVILEDFRDRTDRKTKFDLVAVYKTYPEQPQKKPLLINMDSQAPNKVVQEWLLKQNLSYIKPEYVFGDSRIDFYFEKIDSCGNVEKHLMEVKGCTLEIEGQGYFPDAPTDRGVKHLRELAAACKKGYACHVAFAIQMDGIQTVKPNTSTHPEFETAWHEAEEAGVQFHFLHCHVTDETLEVFDSNLLFKQFDKEQRYKI